MRRGAAHGRVGYGCRYSAPRYPVPPPVHQRIHSARTAHRHRTGAREGRGVWQTVRAIVGFTPAWFTGSTNPEQYTKTLLSRAPQLPSQYPRTQGAPAAYNHPKSCVTTPSIYSRSGGVGKRARASQQPAQNEPATPRTPPPFQPRDATCAHARRTPAAHLRLQSSAKVQRPTRATPIADGARRWRRGGRRGRITPRRLPLP